MVYICQSLANYEKSLPSDKAEATVESLLANFSHKVFFALGDSKTAKWAAELCGSELQLLGGGSVSHAPFSVGSPEKDGGHSSSFQEQYQYAVRPEEFMVGMRTGSPANDYMVDGIVVRSGQGLLLATPCSPWYSTRGNHERTKRSYRPD